MPSDGPEPASPEPVLPRYGERSLAEVLPALLAALGVPGAPPAAGLGLRPVRAAGLLLVDGLGARAVAPARRRRAVPRRDARRRPADGRVPVEHRDQPDVAGHGDATGRTRDRRYHDAGRLDAATELLDTLHWTDPRRTRPSTCASVPARGDPGRATLFERAAAARVAVTVVSARRFKESGLTRAALRGGEFRGVIALGDLAAETITALRGPGPAARLRLPRRPRRPRSRARPGSLPWRMQLAAVDRLAALIAARLPSDAVLVVTGDHGMVTIDRRFDADTHPDLQRDVDLLGGDPRSRLVYARRGAAATSSRRGRRPGRRGRVVPGEQAVAGGGSGRRRRASRTGSATWWSPRAAERPWSGRRRNRACRSCPASTVRCPRRSSGSRCSSPTPPTCESLGAGVRHAHPDPASRYDGRRVASVRESYEMARECTLGADERWVPQT